jgi:hypothetical protein
MNNNFLPLSIIPIILLSLAPTALVFGQTNPWALFQRLCQGGTFATGLQCQNLGTSSSSSICGTNAILQNGVCVPTTSSTTTNGVCGTNAILQNGVCVPTTSSSSSSPFTAGSCPNGFVFQGSFCVPTTTQGTCPTNSTLQNGVCVPFTNPTQSAPVAVAVASPSSMTDKSFVQLNGLGSFTTTSGSTIVSYSWVQTSGPSQTLSGANTAVPSFTVSAAAPATLTFSLTVTDSNGLVSAPSSVTVTVTS